MFPCSNIRQSPYFMTSKQVLHPLTARVLVLLLPSLSACPSVCSCTVAVVNVDQNLATASNSCGSADRSEKNVGL